MRDERPGSEDEEAFPAGERASREGEARDDQGQTYPAGVESDDGRRPGEKLEDEQPGMLDEPPQAD